MEPALTKAQIDKLLHGQHTKVKCTVASTAQGKIGSFFKAAVPNPAQSPNKQKDAESAPDGCLCSLANPVCACSHIHCYCLHW